MLQIDNLCETQIVACRWRSHVRLRVYLLRGKKKKKDKQASFSRTTILMASDRLHCSKVQLTASHNVTASRHTVAKIANALVQLFYSNISRPPPRGVLINPRGWQFFPFPTWSLCLYICRRHQFVSLYWICSVLAYENGRLVTCMIKYLLWLFIDTFIYFILYRKEETQTPVSHTEKHIRLTPSRSCDLRYHPPTRFSPSSSLATSCIPAPSATLMLRK